MAVVDILSTSFLISLGITLLLVGLIGMYFSQKIMDQDHKLSSMAGVVTSMAEELHFLRSKIQQGIPPTLVNPIVSSSEIKLIPVSDDDDEDESDDDSEDDEDSDSDDEDSDDEEDREPLEIMSELINISEVPSIKVINMTESTFYNESIENEVEELVMDEDDDDDDDDMSESEEEQENKLEDEVEVDESTMDLMNSSMLKSINILSSEDDKIDYKKLSLAKLKDLVFEKGLAKDPSRMKKPELLKLLEQ
jgi:hypothetical protein